MVFLPFHRQVQIQVALKLQMLFPAVAVIEPIRTQTRARKQVKTKVKSRKSRKKNDVRIHRREETDQTLIP